MSFLMNAWYVAALSSEVRADTITSRKLLGEPRIALRNSDGRVSVMADICPHRFAPLSRGQLCEGTIECGYHGMRFDLDGRCVENPTQPDEPLPDRTRVVTFPTVERYGFIWFWPGEKEKADAALLPDFWWYERDDYARGYAYKHVAGSYKLMIDNLLDLSHAPFVHKGLLGTRETASQWSLSFEQGERHVTDKRMFPSVPAVPAWAKAYADAFEPYEGPMDHWQETTWHAPANMSLDMGLVMPGADRGTGIDAVGLNLMTPESETSCHYFYGMAHQYRSKEPWVIEFWMNALYHAFEDDRAMIEAVQSQMGQETDIIALRPHINKSDKTALIARRTLDRLIAAEQADGSCESKRELDLTT